VPKKTIRITPAGLHLFDVAGVVLVLTLPAREEDLPLHEPEVVEEQNAVEVIQLVLDGAGDEAVNFQPIGLAVAIQGLEHDAIGSGHIAEDLRNRQTALFGGGASLRLDDHRVDHREALALRVDHGDAPRHPDLVGREPHAVGRLHRLEQVVHEAAQLVVHPGDVAAPLAQNRRAEQVKRTETHPAGAGALDWPTRTMRARSTTTVAVPLSTVTRSSLMSFTLPISPPLVVISSPFLRPASSCSCCFRVCPCGRMIRK
jgi:hypothetical protein